MKRLDLIGKVFNRLRVTKHLGSRNGRHWWLAKCVCGNEISIKGADLQSGHSQSCGCLARERRIAGTKEKLTTHGLSKTRDMASWNTMMQRCNNPDFESWKYYGKKGIRVCAYLAESPVNLISLLGRRPNSKTLDRINSALHYSCGNCQECLQMEWLLNVRWADLQTQHWNKLKHSLLTIGSQTKCIAEWSSISGISQSLIRYRMTHGWKPEHVLKKPNGKLEGKFS
jgi:hypothetical protein